MKAKKSPAPGNVAEIVARCFKPAGPKRSPATVDHATEVLEPELCNICRDLTAAQRMDMAETLQRWVNQLASSVAIADPRLLKLLPPPKVSRGFFLVNISQWQQDNLRALGRACGVPLRGMMDWAVRRVAADLRERIRLAKLLGVNPKARVPMIGACIPEVLARN